METRLRRYRRGFFDFIGDFFSGVVEDVVAAVSDVVNTVVDVVETVVETVVAVAELIGTAIFGGVFSKSKTIDILIGPRDPVPIYKTGDISVMCERMQCGY